MMVLHAVRALMAVRAMCVQIIVTQKKKRPRKKQVVWASGLSKIIALTMLFFEIKHVEINVVCFAC